MCQVCPPQAAPAVPSGVGVHAGALLALKEGIYDMGAIVQVDQARPAESVLLRAEATLCAGGVLVLPTDSVYGIGCAASPYNPALRRVFEIKRRPADMTLPWLIADTTDLFRYGKDVPAWAVRLVSVLWPGALTLIVRASREVPAMYCRAGTNTIALRLPDSILVTTLVRRVGPLAVTSANTHGAPAATTAASLEPRIISKANLILDGGPAPLAIASTIIDCTEGTPCVIREGAIPKTLIWRVACA